MFRRYSDSAIIEGVRQQDEKILNWLYDNYLESVRHHVLLNNGSEDDVSDVFQESVIILYKQINNGSLKLTSDLKGYFFGIARNIWSSFLRKKKHVTEIEIDPPDDTSTEDEDNVILERIIARVFPKLKSDSQIILTLFSEGLTYQEIAKKMNLKSETYARRKKYLSKEALLELIKEDPEYRDYQGFR